MKSIFTLTVFLSGTILHAQTVIGKWKTIDDETGKAKSMVEIYEESGKLYGKVVQLFREPQEDQHPKCDKCEDDRKDQPVLGMIIVRDMILKDGYHQKGTICDPKNGKVYRCEFWLDKNNPNKLQVRGYWGFLYRTQVWDRS